MSSPSTAPTAELVAARARMVTAVVIVGAGLAAFVVIRWLSRGSVPSDFLVYRGAAGAAAHGADIYADGFARPSVNVGEPFTYTPFAALALAPTTLFGWTVNYLLWTASSMVVLAVVLARFVPAGLAHRRAVLAASIGAAALSCVVIQNVRQGQVNIFLMGLCLADRFRRDDTVFGRIVPRGVLVGLATAVKLTPGLFIVFFVLSGQWRLVRGSLAGAAAATLLAAFVHPALSATFFRTALWSLTDRVDLAHPVGYWGNNSIVGAVTAIGPWAVPLAAPAALAFGVWALLAARRTVRSGHDLDAWLIVGLAAPLVSPFSWAHHLVYLLPALTTLVLTRPRARRPLAIGGTAVVVVVLHFGAATGRQWLATSNAWLFVPGVLMRESLVLLSVGGILALRVRRSGSPQSGEMIRVQTRVDPDGSCRRASVG